MEQVTWTLVAILASLILYLFLDFKRKWEYWKERRISFAAFESSLFSTVQMLTGKTPMFHRWTKLYNEFPNDKILGLFSFSSPLVLARDPAFVERVLVKDFHHFVDHDSFKEDKSTMINQGLFNLTGNEWRSYRTKISPTFTTGRLRNMFDELLPCGDALIENMGKSGKIHEIKDIKDDIMTYAMDVSAAVIFGIELKNEELRTKYKKVSTELFNFSGFTTIILMVVTQLPKLAQMLGLKFLNPEHENFFKNIITQTFQQRKAGGSKRNDYVQLLLKLKEMGHVEVKNKDPDDDYLQSDDTTQIEHFEVTDQVLAAQAFQFLTAGFEPIYNTMLFLLLELANNPKIQDKVRREIKEVKAKNEGYNYKSVRDMTYLEQCVHETLRKYPVVPFLVRYCVKDYPVNEYYTMEKGTKVMIPIAGLQRDSSYYPDPEKFDPDRFNPDSPPQNFTYLPFGGGPRVCIGMRFAMMEMKLGLAKIIENYKFTLADGTKFPLALNSKSIFLVPVTSCLNLEKI